MLLAELMAIVENKVILLVEFVDNTLVELRSLPCSVVRCSSCCSCGVYGGARTLDRTTIRFVPANFFQKWQI